MRRTQKQVVRDWLDKGNTLTRLEAFERFGIFELAARIKELEADGYEVDRESKAITTRYGVKTAVTVYSKGV